MHRLIKDCIEARAALHAAMKRSLDADEAADNAPLPSNLRPATADDVVVGDILWHPRAANMGYRCWVQIRKVLDATEDAPWLFVGHDGVKYGLEGAFIEVALESAHGI